jgi:hypothetical protein
LVLKKVEEGGSGGLETGRVRSERAERRERKKKSRISGEKRKKKLALSLSLRHSSFRLSEKPESRFSKL